MEKLNKEQENALAAYQDVDVMGKILLQRVFGKELFLESLSIKKRVLTIEDVFEIVKPTENQLILLNYNGIDKKMIGAKNFMIAEMICEVLNEGWVGDFTNDNERKWFPVFDGETGFAFSGSSYYFTGTNAGVGSRLLFKSEALSDYAGKQFNEVFKQILTK